MTQVSLSTSTNYSGQLNALVEDQGTELTVRFDLDQPAPAGGLKVFLDSNVVQSFNRLTLTPLLNPNSRENIDVGSSSFENNNSAIAVFIEEGASFASFTLPVFDDPEPSLSFPETFEGLVEVTFTLKTADQVSGVSGIGDYTIDSSASSSLVLFADTASQLPPETSTPRVSISATPTDLVEEEGTLTTLTINLSEPPPSEGINVTFDSDIPNSLAQFNVLQAVYDGAFLVAPNEDVSGFTVNVFSQTATIQLAPFDDDVNEGPQNIVYTLQASDNYTIDSAASSV
ncbi:MAG: calcium-binding protein, partial [Cyanobacteria bacterium J06636_27]